MREIQLTKGYVTQVDDEDYQRLVAFASWQAKVSPSKNGGCVYVFTMRRIKGTKKYKHVSMHRMIMNLLDSSPTIEVDHIDGNPLNNQKSNLRICNNPQNSRNKKKPNHKPFTSTYKGVNWKKNLNKWITQICYNNTKIHIGCYESEEVAAKAYDRKARELFGEFAVLNFPEITEYNDVTEGEQRQITSNYFGVSLVNTNKYQANVWCNGKNNLQGLYKTELEAAKAYDMGARRLLGDKAKLNFPDVVDHGILNPILKKQSSQYKGVSDRKNAWEANITINGKLQYIGRFKTEELAAMAFDEKCIELNMKDKCNFPLECYD